MTVQIVATTSGWNTHISRDGETTACGKRVAEVLGEYGDAVTFFDIHGDERTRMLQASCHSRACSRGLTAKERSDAVARYIIQLNKEN